MFQSHYTVSWGIALFCLVMMGNGYASEKPAWHQVAYKVATKPSLAQLADKHHALFDFFLKNALEGKGKEDFLKVTARTRNKIQWRDDNGTNIYNDAFRRSYDFVSKMDLKGMPDTVMLIPYLESQWHGKKGRKDGDYGYWQFVPDVIKEIQTLDYVPAAVRTGDIDAVRADPQLSTEAAKVHLHRYHFYFANVAKYSESDAWLLTFVAFNWGAGNVKRMMADLEAEGIEPNFSNFYHRLYSTYQKNKGDRSMRAAVEYVPSLWNIAQLVKKAN